MSALDQRRPRQSTVPVSHSAGEGGVKARFDTLTNVAVITMCVAITVFVVVRMSGTTTNRPPANPYKVGETIGTFLDARFEESDLTVLLLLQTACKLCEESVPFYRRLIEQRPPRPGAVRVLAVLSEPHDVGQRFLDNSLLKVDALIGLPAQTAGRISGTPTLLLVDRRRSVRGVWIGKLSRGQEAEVVSAIRKGALP